MCAGQGGEPCKTAEPIEMLSWGADMCEPKEPLLDGGAHCRHLAKTTK